MDGIFGGKNPLVNALSFALPYDPKALEFVGVEVKNMKNMENLTNDRLHTNGTKALYTQGQLAGDLRRGNGQGLSQDGFLRVVGFGDRGYLLIKIQCVVSVSYTPLDVYKRQCPG